MTPAAVKISKNEAAEKLEKSLANDNKSEVIFDLKNNFYIYSQYIKLSIKPLKDWESWDN